MYTFTLRINNYSGQYTVTCISNAIDLFYIMSFDVMVNNKDVTAPFMSHFFVQAIQHGAPFKTPSQKKGEFNGRRNNSHHFLNSVSMTGFQNL